MKQGFPYEDIIRLPHPVSKNHGRMPIRDRAAQFSPFAALTGHEAAILEAARLTEKKQELDENKKAQLDMRLALLRQRLRERPELRIKHFVPDKRKDGGSYVTVPGKIRKIDEYARKLIMTDGQEIEIENIYDIDGEIFAGPEFREW